MNIREKRKKLTLRLRMLVLVLAAVILLPALTALAADGDVKADHGAVKIRSYDYDKLVRRLTAKYPGIFKTAAVYNASTRRNVGTSPALRVLFTNSPNHRSSGNSGTTVRYLNGSSRSTSNWALGLGGFEANEYFTVDGDPAYCFDWTTPSATGQHLLSASLSEAGITVGTGANVTELAQVAKMLTKDNYALIAGNASAVARGLSIAAFTNPDHTWISSPAVTIPKSDVEALLRDTTADGIAFKRALVQMLVWGKMNAISYGDWLYSLTADSGYWDKEGNWVSQGETVIAGPIIGYASVIDLNKLYDIGRTAWEEQIMGASADYEYQYELTVGVPFNVPAADVSRIVKIAEANGGRIESGGSVAVGISADKRSVTLTAREAIPNWTAWLGTSESSNMIYSSKPYRPSSSGTTGNGQFIVDVSEMVYMRARDRAVMPTGTLTVTKSSANPAVTDGNACYSLAGAKYGIYTDSTCTQPAKSASGSDAVLVTAADGRSNSVTLNAGTYYVKEISPSPGYGLAAGTYPVTVARDEAKNLSAADSAIFREPPLNDPMALFIRKTAAKEYGVSDFDMSGAQYTVRYYAGQYAKETLPGEANAVWVIETKKTGSVYAAYLADGYVVSGSPVYGKNAGGGYVIPLGTLTLEETKAPAGFRIEGSTLQLLNGNGSDASDGVVLFNLVDRNSAVSVISGNETDDTEEGIQILQKETVAAVNVRVLKTSDDGAVGGLSFTLSGTLTAGGTYSETRVTDESGTADFGEVPYGSFTLSENLSEEQARIYLANGPVNLTLDANSVNPYTVSFSNALKRGSMTFTKVLKGSGAALANVPFKLTNTDTGEEHYFITDENGAFSTERGTHAAGTNGADQALSAYVPDKDIIPDAVMDELVSAGAASCGVWFGPGPADDAKKALPVGSYKLEEMKTEGRKTLVLESRTFKVASDGQVIELGSIEDAAIEIGTAAKDAATGTQNAFAGPDAKIVDTVTYSGCRVGETYAVNGELMLAEDDGAVTALGVTAAGTFTAEASSGSTSITFTFDASALAGKKIVAYETLLTSAGQFAAEHKDPTDASQIISFPKIGTAARDSETGIGVSEADGSVTVIDTVSYENLIPGTEYTLKGELFDKASGRSTGITAEKKFTPAAASGSVEVRFSFSGTALAGRALTVYETLCIGSGTLAEHRNIRDDAQTVYFPKIGTVLLDSRTGTHHVLGEGTVTLTDTVTYASLRPGRQYTLKGELMDKATGESTGITAEKTFTPNSADGTAELVFTFDGAALRGRVVTAFERIFCGNAEVAAHADLEDAGQTVYVPGIDTSAAADDTEAHVTGPNEQISITDRVDFTGLEAGREYRLRGELYDKESGEPMGITAEKTFTAEASEGHAELSFTFDGSLLAGRTVVAFESLYTEQEEVAVHRDIDDEDQSVHVPGIETDAADTGSGLNHIEANAAASVTDTVTYLNLLPGKEYAVKGELYDKETGASVGVTAETAFIPEKADGSAEIVFTFDASALGGKTLVAFEKLFFGDVVVAAHEDIDDVRQTVHLPKTTTEAKNDETGTREGTVGDTVTVTDEVSYAGLVPGEEYVLKGILMDRETGKALRCGGREVTAEAAFVPEEAEGTVEMHFTFSSVSLAGRTAVVFETLYYRGTEVAVHADIEDENQAVVFPEITTKASDAESGRSSLRSGRIADEIGFAGLTPGAAYVIVTTVWDRTAGSLLDVREEHDFSPEAPEGTLRVTVTADPEGLEGHRLVIFEELWLLTKNGRVLAAEHRDPAAKEQTVSVPAYAPSTGDRTGIFLHAAVMAAAGAGIIFAKKRRGCS